VKFKPTTGNRILSDVAFIVLDHGGVREAGRQAGRGESQSRFGWEAFRTSASAAMRARHAMV
jgi:hypothetical protein